MNKLDELKKIREQINLVVKGLENYDSQVPSLFIANHNCLLDIFYLPMAIPEQIVSLISSRLIYKKEIKRQELVNKYLDTLPIEAHGGKVYSDLCLKYASQTLENGNSLSIFPEGAYVSEQVIHKGRTGATRILYDTKSKGIDVNLIPISINLGGIKADLDDYSAFDENVLVTILNPIDYSEQYYEYINTKDVRQKNLLLHIPIDNGMKQIAKNLGREYKDEYIQLRPKGNVIFSDGSTIPTSLAHEDIYIKKYEEQIKVKTLEFLK